MFEYVKNLFTREEGQGTSEYGMTIVIVLFAVLALSVILTLFWQDFTELINNVFSKV
ncbi:MAG: hypothetical protein AB9844_12365 [Clostridiaceae bacterium]